VNPNDPIVFIVDDDRRICEALSELLSTFDLHVVTFGSAAEYIAYPKPDVPSCLILDVELPDINGLDLQSQTAQGDHPQIVFITGHGDIPMSVKAMKAGAIEFLTKPIREQDLLDAVRVALDRDSISRAEQISGSDLRVRYELLTPREQDVMALVITGLMNKQVSNEMGITEATVKFHRGHIMRKMGARSLADLVRMAGSLGIHHAK